jgi:polar amino acid transport system substrate-binding protein
MHNSNKWFIPFILCFLFSIAPLSGAYAKTLVIGADPWCPYNCVAGSKKPGFMVELAQTIFEQAGFKIKYINLNWARAKLDLNSGVLDAVVGMAKGAANKKLWIYPENALGEEQMCFYSNKPDWKYEGINSLTAIRLGVINGYGYGAEIQPYILSHKSSHQVTALSGNHLFERLIEMLRKGRIDAFIDDHNVAEHFLSIYEGKASKIQQVGCLSKRRGIYIVFSKRNPDAEFYANLLSKGVQRLRQNGQLKTILNRYGLSDWK